MSRKEIASGLWAVESTKKHFCAVKDEFLVNILHRSAKRKTGK